MHVPVRSMMDVDAVAKLLRETLGDKEIEAIARVRDGPAGARGHAARVVGRVHLDLGLQ